MNQHQELERSVFTSIDFFYKQCCFEKRENHFSKRVKYPGDIPELAYYITKSIQYEYPLRIEIMTMCKLKGFRVMNTLSSNEHPMGFSSNDTK